MIKFDLGFCRHISCSCILCLCQLDYGCRDTAVWQKVAMLDAVRSIKKTFYVSWKQILFIKEKIKQILTDI